MVVGAGVVVVVGATHTSAEVAAVAALCVPSGQSVHATDPALAAYVSIPQSAQVDPSAAPEAVEKVPAPQLVQVDSSAAPEAVENVPAAQLLQAEAPAAAKVPAPQ